MEIGYNYFSGTLKGEVGLKLKDVIESVVGRVSEEDAVTLLERLYRLVEYVGKT